MNKSTYQVIFKGRVQGVGFRWTVVDYAERHHVTGYVRNVRDGTVEALIQGEEPRIEAFLEQLQKDTGAAHITSIEKTALSTDEIFTDFRISH